MSNLEKDILDILASGASNRGSYHRTMEEFLGREIPYEPPSRKERFMWRWEHYKDRFSRAYQILRRGYYDGEGE